MTQSGGQSQPESAAGDGFPLPLSIRVAQESDVSHIRITVSDLATRTGLGEVNVGRLAIAVTELAKNLVQHATGGGRITATPLSVDGQPGIELVVEDDGPGIADLDRAMTDGFTTGPGLGSGLPASRRQMDEFSIDSDPGRGTRVIARIWR